MSIFDSFLTLRWLKRNGDAPILELITSTLRTEQYVPSSLVKVASNQGFTLQATQAVGPALAVGVAFARASFYGCTFKSYQDTVFIGKNARQSSKAAKSLGQRKLFSYLSMTTVKTGLS